MQKLLICLILISLIFLTPRLRNPLVLFDIFQDGGRKFSDGIDGLKLYIKGIQSEIEYLKSWHLVEEDQWIFQQSEESFSKLVSAGDLLIDEELREVADDVLKLDLERAPLLVKHFTQIHCLLLAEQRLQFFQFFLALYLMHLQRELQILDADLLGFAFFGHC